METRRESGPVSPEPQEKHLHGPDKQNASPSRRNSQGRADPITQAEHLGIAVRIVRNLADTLPGEQAKGALACLIALRLEVARVLAKAVRPA